MVNHHIVLIALLATLCGQFITVQAQGNTDGNRQYFVDYLEFVKAGLGRKGERPPAFQRYKGTYWEATKVLNVADAVQKPADTAEWPGECGVAFYFDDMPRRLKSIQNKKAAAQTFAKPLAIAPVCEGGVRPETDGQYPISSSQGNRVVFEQYRPAPKGGAKNDAYFILQNASNADADCLQLEHFQNQQWQFPDEDQASIEEFWKLKDGADSTKDIPDFAPDMFKDWVKQYIVDTRGDAFCIPNPRKFGKGNQVWSDWNWLSTFWGYTDDDTWNTDPPAGSSRKRSRIEGPL